ncbi:hypothetical protein Tco_0837777 [Tanacetum coccineum]
MSFDNNGLDLNFRTSDFHNNVSNQQNKSHFEKPECSFAFGDYHEYEDEKNEFDDVVNDNPLPNYQSWQKYMSFKPDIPETPLYKSKPMDSKDYKKEADVKVGQIFDNKKALDLAIRLKGLDEGYQFLNERSAPERSNVHMKLQEALDEEAILEEQILTLMHHFADRFTDRRVKINNLMVLQDHPLIDYGKYAFGCMTGADMKNCVHLKSVRDELLRSMEEKR